MRSKVGYDAGITGRTLIMKHSIILTLFILIVAMAPLHAVTLIPDNNDCSAKEIFINNSAIEFFKKDQTNYTYYLPYTHPKDQIPEVTVILNNPGQRVTVLSPVNLTGSQEERTAKVMIASDDKPECQTYRITYEILPELDLFLFIGQSNMAGRGYMDPEAGDMKPVQNTYLFTPCFHWEEATNPFNKYSSVRKQISLQRISPAYGFAQHMSAQISKKIGLIVNARGATTIKQWMKGSPDSLYDAALIRIKEAMKWGKVKAILWHQGEGDSGRVSPDPDEPGTYPYQLKKMVADFRHDLGDPNIPIIAGELAYWRGNGEGSANFNKMIRTISDWIPHSDWVSADGTTPLINETDPHFDRASNILLGERYAVKVLQHVYMFSSLPKDSKF
jgi:hypothetical protein